MNECTSPSDKCFVKVYKCSACQSNCVQNSCVIFQHSCNLIPEVCIHDKDYTGDWKLIHTITFDIDEFRKSIVEERKIAEETSTPLNYAHLSGFLTAKIITLIDEYQKLLGVETHEDYLKREVV